MGVGDAEKVGRDADLGAGKVPVEKFPPFDVIQDAGATVLPQNPAARGILAGEEDGFDGDKTPTRSEETTRGGEDLVHRLGANMMQDAHAGHEIDPTGEGLSVRLDEVFDCAD